MLVQTERTLALRCSACGRLAIQPFSLFAFSKGRTHSVECPCGFRIALLNHRSRIPRTTFTCVVCEASHPQELRRLWVRELISLRCQATGVDVGYIGTEERVREAIAGDGSLESLLFDPECEGYFANPKVMHEVLSAVQAMAEVGRVRCACGADRVELDIYSERIELICSACGGATSLSGATEEDLQIASNLQELVLPSRKEAID